MERPTTRRTAPRRLTALATACAVAVSAACTSPDAPVPVDTVADLEPVNGPRLLDAVPTPVRVVDRAYEPAIVEVAAGETVTWRNEGTLDHWVVSRRAEVFDSAPLEPGNTYAHTFDEVGTFDYTCTIHPEMRGTVVVREPSGADDR
jgi:plastocyanin